MIEVGTISEVRGDRARVAIGSLVTDFLPVLQLANSFVQSWTPIAAGEQVAILPVRGDLNAGIVLRGLFYSAHPAPSLDSKTQTITYEDGTKITYNTEAKELKIEAAGDVNISCKNASVKADKVTVDSASIDLGQGGAGVVTGACMCALTGLAHHDFSSNTRSAK